jgi:4-hydroxy-tetrahydrodipicolinate synthase
LAQLRSATAGALAIGYSGDWGIADALLSRADGFYSAVAGVLPVEFLRLHHAAVSGDRDETQRLDAAFAPLWSLIQAFGGLRVSYCVASLLGVCDARPPLPIHPLPLSETPRVTDALASIATALA